MYLITVSHNSMTAGFLPDIYGTVNDHRSQSFSSGCSDRDWCACSCQAA
jgi:hypothetical protein